MHYQEWRTRIGIGSDSDILIFRQMDMFQRKVFYLFPVAFGVRCATAMVAR